MERYKDSNGRILGVGSDMPLNGSIATAAEVLADDARIAEALKPKEVSRAQFFAALIISGLDVIVDNAVMNSGDKLLINDYKNRLTFRRDWNSFVSMATALNFTSADIDALFELASAQ